METPNNANGTRTEKIMRSIKKEIYSGKMDVSKYNRMYEIVYETLMDDSWVFFD